MASSPYENAVVVLQRRTVQDDGGATELKLLAGDGPAVGHHCIHRVTTDANGRLKSDIVYFYEPVVPEAKVKADFALLQQPGLMSVSQLNHTASMLNRGQKTERSPR